MLNSSKQPKQFNTAYFVFRTWARFIGSVFFSFFRAWGETDQSRHAGRLIIVKNYGLVTWLTILRTFRAPVRFVFASDQKDRWFDLAEGGGLTPVRLKRELPDDCETLKSLAGEDNVVLIIPPTSDEFSKKLTLETRKTFGNKLLFLAISGACESLPEGVFVPKACPISVFCGLPHLAEIDKNDPFAELHFLEKAISDVPLNELPSIFANHQRNIQPQKSCL